MKRSFRSYSMHIIGFQYIKCTQSIVAPSFLYHCPRVST